MSFILGLDVGTSSVAGATKRDGRVQPCSLGDRTATLPSVVVLHDDGTTVVGEEAERVAGLELPRIARDVRLDPVEQLTPIKVGGHVHTPHELLRTLYSTIVERVVYSHGATPSHLVVTHPAIPEGMRCEMVERISEELFPGAVVVPEPIAAAVKLACDGSLPADCVVAVYDFGGGTFDLTLVRRDGDRFSMVAEPAGLPSFGGIDVDDLILDHVNQGLGGAVTRLDLADPAAMAALTRLRIECRAAKERLSYEPDVAIEAALPGEPGMVHLTRAGFENMLLPNLEQTVDVLQRTVAEAGLRPDDVDTVALVGGSSRIPLVADLLGARTTIPVLVDPYPELTVALGACQMVDDEASSSSVFPLSDLALPTLAAFSGTAAAGAAAAAGAGVGGGPGGGGLLDMPLGRLSDSPGGHLEPGLGLDPDEPTEFDQMMQRGREMDGRDDHKGRPGGLPEGLNPKVGVAVLAGVVVVLLMAVILFGGGGDGPGEAETAGASGTQTPSSSTSVPGSSSSSAASSSTSSSSSTTTTEDEDETDEDCSLAMGQISYVASSPQQETTTTTTTTEPPTTTTTTTTTEPPTPTTRPPTPTTRPPTPPTPTTPGPTTPPNC